MNVDRPVPSRVDAESCNTVFWSRPDILTEFLPEIKADDLKMRRIQVRKELLLPYWDELRSLLPLLAFSEQRCSAASASFRVTDDGTTVEVGKSALLSQEQHVYMSRVIELLVPWRKGPFDLCGHFIDAEWRSDLKWRRLLPALDGAVAGARVADVGCSNGYYMFRLLELCPEWVLGFDPSARSYYSFELMQRFARSRILQMEMLGLDDLAIFPQFFDLVLFMGVIYHQRDPLRALRTIRESLRPGGTLIVESQTVVMKGSYALCPAGRYAKAHNVFFLPSADCLVSWLEKSGFADCEVIDETKVTEEEQRATALMPYESLSDFLNPQNRDLTIEGYPAPHRTIVRARRKG